MVIEESEEDADMKIPIRCHLKRRKLVGHGPTGAKRKKLLTLTPQELPSQEHPKMKSTSPEVLKSASLSSHHIEEEVDAFWNALPRVDDTTGSTTAGSAPEERQDEGMQQQETIQERPAETSSVLPTTDNNSPSELLLETAFKEDRGKAAVDVDSAYPTVVPASVARTSTSIPSPPQSIKETRSIMNSINQSVDARIAAERNPDQRGSTEAYRIASI
ncbi:hypothetical protein Dimus_026747, partial [Dionaea muscipula]